jgi:hypothetical protein
MGVDSVMAERNANPGDNWALRYDCMRFHVPTSTAEMPFMCEFEFLRIPNDFTKLQLTKAHIQTSARSSGGRTASAGPN